MAQAELFELDFELDIFLSHISVTKQTTFCRKLPGRTNK